MAGIKISGLPMIPSSQLSDIAPFVQSGTTYAASLSQIQTLFSGTLTLNSIAQVTGLTAILSSYLPLSGGTMTGDLFLNGNPTTSNQAANKGYVDTVASGFTVILSCYAATTANLNATQSGAGVGATLTNAGTFAVFAVDGVTPPVNSRILVKNQTLSQHNGVYVLTTVGDAISVNWVLTRATDYDTAAQIKPGTLISVNNGTVNGTTSWLETATVVTVDTDPIVFSQFTFAPAAFLQIANNLSELTATAATARANIGLGTVSTKAASDASKATASMVSGSTTIGHVAVFSDVNGTIMDGGESSGTVTSIATSGLATGGTITASGTITVTASVKANQIAASSNTVAVTPAVQQFHPSSAKAWVKFQGNPVVIYSSYNVTNVARTGVGLYTITFTTPFTSANNYCALVGSSGNSGGQNGALIQSYTASTVSMKTEDGSGGIDPSFVNLVAFGTQ